MANDDDRSLELDSIKESEYVLLKDKLYDRLCKRQNECYISEDVIKEEYSLALNDMMVDIYDAALLDDQMKENIVSHMLQLDAFKEKKNNALPNAYKGPKSKSDRSKHGALMIPIYSKEKVYVYGDSKYSLVDIAQMFIDGTFDDKIYGAMTSYYGNSDLASAFISTLTGERYTTFVDSFLSAVLFDDELLDRYFNIKHMIRIDTDKIKKDKFFGGK